jgi:predicted MPP superfamily phosphohydrolase
MRRFALRCGIVLLALASLGSQAARGERVSGVVFLDANGNGRRDAGEGGVAEALVTDGMIFAATNAEGRYGLDAQVDPLVGEGKRPILTLTFPSGTWPTAGWMRRLDAAADTENVDFGLRRQEQTLPFLFIHGTDPHVPRGGKVRFPAFRAEVAQQKDRLAFAVLTGDLVNLVDDYGREKALADFRLFAEGVGDFPVPVFCVSGNHDVAGVRAKKKNRWDTADPLYGYGMYWKFVGPLRWSFNYAGVHCAGIDFNRKVKGKWEWGVPKSAVDWLRRDLDRVPEGSRVLLFVHSPSGDAGLHQTLREKSVTQIFCGHSHAVGPITVAGVPALQSGSISQVGEGLKTGYSIVRVTADSIEHVYKPLGEPLAEVKP